MWGGFDFGLKEALEKAKHDFERSVDTALGIEEAQKKQQEEQKQAGKRGNLSSNSAEIPSTTGERTTAVREGDAHHAAGHAKQQQQQQQLQADSRSSNCNQAATLASSAEPSSPAPATISGAPSSSPAAKKGTKKVTRKLVTRREEHPVPKAPSPGPQGEANSLPVSVPASEPATSTAAAPTDQPGTAAAPVAPSTVLLPPTTEHQAPLPPPLPETDPPAAPRVPSMPHTQGAQNSEAGVQEPTQSSNSEAGVQNAAAPDIAPAASQHATDPQSSLTAQGSTSSSSSSTQPGSNGPLVATKSSKRRAALGSKARAQQQASHQLAPQQQERTGNDGAAVPACELPPQEQERAGKDGIAVPVCEPAPQAPPETHHLEHQHEHAPHEGPQPQNPATGIPGGEGHNEAKPDQQQAEQRQECLEASSSEHSHMHGGGPDAYGSRDAPGGSDVTAQSGAQGDAAVQESVQVSGHAPPLQSPPGKGSEPMGGDSSSGAAAAAPAVPVSPAALAQQAEMAPSSFAADANSRPSSSAAPAATSPEASATSTATAPAQAPSPQLDSDPVSQSSAAPSAGQDPLPAMSNGESEGAVRDDHDLSKMSQAQAVAVAEQLREALASRQLQMVRQAEQMSEAQEVIAQLQQKNEELVLKTAKISEQELEEMRAEFEKRLGAAERKVYALTKERDALKRGNEKLGDYGNLLREKDDIIKQVMTEGERLAGKQAELEGTLKKLRQQMKDSETERTRLSSKLVDEEAVSEGLRKAKSKLERDITALLAQHKAELDAQRQEYDAALQKARAEQSKHEERAREAANMGLSRRLKEAESRCEAFSETVMDLREALDRQRQAADLREEMLKQDLADLEKRCQAAELRHQDLAAKLPDTARPLLRQIEAMQAAAEAQQEAWTAAEATLNARIIDAEARGAAAVERERHTAERAQVIHTKLAGLEAALAAARGEVRSLTDASEAWEQERKALAEQLQGAQRGTQLATERCQILSNQLEQLEKQQASLLAAERGVRAAAEADAALICKDYERRLGELEAQLEQHQGSGFAGLSSMGPFGGGMDGGGKGQAEPPAMAAPGYRWVLQKDKPAEPATPPAPSGQQQLEQPYANGVSGEDVEASSSSRSQSGAALAATAESPADELLSSLSPMASGSMVTSQMQQQQQETLRAALRARVAEVHSLEAQVKSLEATRDRLAEELVQAAQKSEQAADMASEVEDLRSRYAAAVEMLGERDESLEELRADLQDVKNLYRDQIEFMVMQLVEHQQQHEQQQQQKSLVGQGASHQGAASGTTAS